MPTSSALTTAKKSSPAKKPPKSYTDIQAVVNPKVGQLTFDAEGQEGGRYASRYLHVPSDSSGLTIGRGYDMKKKSGSQILADLVSAGLTQEDANKLTPAARLSGALARTFVEKNSLQDFSITPTQQARLFELSYAVEAAETQRIATKEDVTAKYGACDWAKLDPAIKAVLIDLKFRGDYTPTSRTLIQKHVAANDLAAFAKAMSQRSSWAGVPQDRFQRRVAFLKTATATLKTTVQAGMTAGAAKVSTPR
jgi:hypothetical protein